jgi:hypothetical protein
MKSNGIIRKIHHEVKKSSGGTELTCPVHPEGSSAGYQKHRLFLFANRGYPCIIIRKYLLFKGYFNMANLTFSMENYLEAVYELSAGNGAARVSDIAARLDVSKASVNSAMNALHQRGLVTNEK